MYSSSSCVSGKRVFRLGRSESGTSNSSTTCDFLGAVVSSDIWLASTRLFGRAISPISWRLADGDLLASQFSLTTGSLILGFGSHLTQLRCCLGSIQRIEGEGIVRRTPEAYRSTFETTKPSVVFLRRTYLEFGFRSPRAALSVLGVSNHC